MKRFFLFACSCAFLFSCQKDYNRDPGVSTYVSYETAMASEAPKPKIATINATTGGSIRGNGGAQYVFQPNSFVTQSGMPVTGDVQIKATECVDKSDMLFSDMLPEAADGPLESGGEALVSASQNSEPLQLAPGIQYEVVLPRNGSTAGDMELFIGAIDQDTKQLAWRTATSQEGRAVVTGDSIRLQTTQVGYVNADKYYRYTPCNVSLNVRYHGAAVNSSFSLYIVVSGRNVMYRTKKPENGFAGNVTVPSSDVYFVAVGFVENSLCAAAIKPPITQGATFTIDVEKTTPQKLKTLMKSM